jgi:hypothetical protein
MPAHVQNSVDDDERQVLWAEGLDPDDPAVIAGPEPLIHLMNHQHLIASEPQESNHTALLMNTTALMTRPKRVCMNY